MNLFIKPPFDQNLIVEGKEVLSFSFAFFNNDWDLVLSSMRGRPFRIIGDLDLSFKKIESLGNLQSVGGCLGLRKTNIESLGNLISVGESLGLRYTPLSKKYSEDQIRKMVNVAGEIIL